MWVHQRACRCVVCRWRGQARFQSPLWEEFSQLSANVKEVFQTLIDLRSGLPTAVQQSVSKTSSVITAFFVVCIVLCNLLYYPSLVTSLNKSIKGNRALLLLLPEDVIHSVKVLRETMAALSKKLM